MPLWEMLTGIKVRQHKTMVADTSFEKKGNIHMNSYHKPNPSGVNGQNK